MSFSLVFLPDVPGSRPPCPGSITMVATLVPVVGKEAEEFSKVIAIRRTFIGIFLTNVAMCDRIEITLHKVVNFSQHAKYLLTLTISKGIVVRFIILFTSTLLIFCSTSFAQQKKLGNQPAKTKPAFQDTSKIKKDSTSNRPKSDIESTITYSADDSIVSELGRKIVRLYGNAKVNYGQINLDAEEIVIDYEQSTITANGKKDSTGQLVGFPIFKDGQTSYETKGMVYNFKNKKAKITEVVTKQGEGFMHGESVYKNDKNELFTRGNAYTTCDLADPHYRIISSKAKAIPGTR